jgi:GT2 family glycosyltransferase
VQPKIAIVILNWNGSKYLQQFLPSVLGSTYPNKEIIVADNASTDDSMAMMGQVFPYLGVIPLDRNFGFATTGYNLALKQVQADYYLLLNSDVEVSPGGLEPMVELMENNKTIGACQPKLHAYTDRSSFEYAGAAGGWLDFLGYPFARGRIFDFCEKDHGQYDDESPVFWASGAALMVRAGLYHDIGGMDGYFFAHQEEIDFCWRLQLAGHAVFVCPRSVVYHLGGGTLPRK